ncbi:efflux transporter outer membrane subunit [Paraburkholderia fungorum]|uniref:Transporter n=1 Tax=Paraburkholderia fungorum TaxID=134537 RepID=A0A420GSZ5_9BURK|nr:efflux transporter outer membrane subunit [Paraburkholderia fungorum]RKF48276.1 transporter [Paraburkholderia fungorum]
MKHWVIGFTVFGLYGCASHAPVDSGITPPATWQYSPVAATQTGPARTDWWTGFGNSELNSLVRQADANSFDIAASIARVEQAQASARIAGAALLPTVSGFADASRQGGLLVSDTELAGTAFDVGLAASYELDFWGRNRALRDAALAKLRASAFDRDTVALTVNADVANTWLQTVALRERYGIARENLRIAQQILATVESQFRAGAATPIDLAQQRALVAAQRRSAALLGQQANDSQATLAVLLGIPVSSLQLSTTALDELRIPGIDAGVPSSLLVQRPDLARAEAQLQAASANVTAARAAMLPGVTLTGSVGFGNDRIRTLFDNSLYSIAAGLTAPIFSGGSLAAGRDLAVAQKEELLANYRQAIIAAFGDVERALNAIQGVDAQRAAQDEELEEARRALELAQSRYRAGAETLLAVLAAQQTRYRAEDENIQLRLARLQGAVALFRALGGGWREDEVRAGTRSRS